MGKTKPHIPVKLITGFIFADDNTLNKAVLYLTKKFGAIDYKSGVSAFNHTGYYENEFGKDLKRKLISFKKLVAADELASIKLFTNKIEQKLCFGKANPVKKLDVISRNFSNGARRQVNIDPGYIELSKLILATTKDYSHRIYIGKGIYAEVTLSYRDKTFKCNEWTYPDYRTPEYIETFNHIREIYARQIR